MEGSELQVAALLVAGIVVGVWLLARGMDGYRTAVRIADTGTSRIATLAAGEVRVSGRIATAEVLLVSSLQSVPCVYYRATIERGDDDDVDGSDDQVEERAVGFRVVDDSGDVRVFPRGARWDAPVRFDDRTGTFGDEPAGLSIRTGGAVAAAEVDRETTIAALLTVRPAMGTDGEDGADAMLGAFGGGAGRRRRRYREARLAPGDEVTVIGRAMPFSDLADPTEADEATASGLAADDPEVAADLAEARAAGLLADDPEAAWGNATIPGFGVGRPVRPPALDAGADALPIASTEDAARIERRFTIAPNTLVLASAPDVPLLIAHGVPGVAADRHHDLFIVGLLGAVLAIGSATALALVLGDGFAAR